MKKLVCVFICLLTFFTCQGEIITVDDDGSADFKNIQDAINASQDGDTVIVKPGNYNKNIFFNGRAITVSSEDPSNPSIVQSTVITTTLVLQRYLEFSNKANLLLYKQLCQPY